GADYQSWGGTSPGARLRRGGVVRPVNARPGGQATARRLVAARCKEFARCLPAGPEAICRGRTVVAERVQRAIEARTRREETTTLPDRGLGAAHASLRRMEQAERGGQVARGIGGGEESRQEELNRRTCSEHSSTEGRPMRSVIATRARAFGALLLL